MNTMDLSKVNALITGGSQGIGLGLAIRLLKAGSRVMITGRDPAKLQNAAENYPGLLTWVNDISDPQQRELLASHVRKTMPGLNVLINNAGIQRRVSLAADRAVWKETQTEIDTLFSAPVHLNHLLIPLILSSVQPGLIINVTSGGAYIPQVFAPVYSSCKAAFHHYTLILRHALSKVSCRVVELAPPAVRTDLAGPGLTHGAPLDEFCDAVFPKLFGGDDQVVGFGQTEHLDPSVSGRSVYRLFEESLSRFPVECYSETPVQHE